ncbi:MULTISPECIES: amidohydrolase family protein [unclassified Nocardioides]|uniref:amidohydrolase family protein n=1 Tax=unclassified Nocardioides TaxID=2615069 RepID=UPI000702ECF0|nr:MULTISPECIES: amidohydrolase family protein [unclassified Nocardioides]KRC46393.1 amidohydrolase [Nocardioides sp. Root79]KRC69738.1 amidohydrolase [Nocardioides sp. Root240]
MTEGQEVRAFWQQLGLSGLIDLHVHFLPPPIERAVWAVFDSAGPKIGRPWPIRYRDTIEERVAQLRDFGVRRFPTHPYAHKPGVASYLNEWSRTFAETVPEVVRSATFYPEPEAAGYVPELIGDGVQIFKIHLQVGEFVADDPVLDPVWGVLEDAGTPVTVHAGSGPVGNAFTGPDSVARLLRRHPRLCLLVAHMGAPEYEDFLVLAERYDNVHLDTTMVFTDFFDQDAAYPAALVPRLKDLQPKVLLGSDFPTIPYPYQRQLEGLARLDLGDDWLRDVCWHNAVRLLARD